MLLWRRTQASVWSAGLPLFGRSCVQMQTLGKIVESYHRTGEHPGMHPGMQTCGMLFWLVVL